MAKAPGRNERQGISLVELARAYPDDDTAEAWFVSRRWPDGVRCPSCGNDSIQDRPNRKPQPYRCRGCLKDFSVKTGTVMHGSKLGYQTWLFAIYLELTSLKGVSSMKLHRDLGITQKTAWHLSHRIREAWEDHTGPFVGPIEADEVYIGGRERNKHASKRLRTARGVAGKTPVAGAKDRETGLVSALVVRDTGRSSLQPFVVERTRPGATLYTDDHGAYKGTPGVRHETVNHSAGEYVRGLAHTNGIESFWAMLRRGLMGTFHQVSTRSAPSTYSATSTSSPGGTT